MTHQRFHRYNTWLLALLPLLALGQEPSTRTLALTGHVELDLIPTALTITVPWRDYGEQPLAAFLQQDHPDGAEQAFAELMAALVANNPGQASTYLPSSAHVNAYHQAFGGFRTASVVGRVSLPPVNLFLWQVQTTQGPFLRSFTVDDSNAGYRAELVGSSLPLRTLLLHSIEQARQRPTAYRPQPLPPAEDGWQHYRLPIVLADTPAVQVELVARGYPISLNVFEETLLDLPPALAFYQQSWQLVAEQRLEEFLDRHTPGSREKRRGWATNADDLSQGRWVWWLLDAAPLSLVFYTDGPNAERNDGILRLDTVWQDPDSGEFRLTNVAYRSHLDSVLEDRDHFPTTPATLQTLLEASQLP